MHSLCVLNVRDVINAEMVIVAVGLVSQELVLGLQVIAAIQPLARGITVLNALTDTLALTLRECVHRHLLHKPAIVVAIKTIIIPKIQVVALA